MSRKATNISVARAMATNEPNIRKWFVEYTKVLHDLKITSLVQIWSGDEIGIQNIPKEEKVLCEKCKLAYQTVADQGETSLVLTFVNGIGDVIPAMMLHKGQQVQVTWTQDVPVGVHVTATSKGYITKFHKYSI